MTKYVVKYWEKESVWVRRETVIEAQTEPTTDQIPDLIEQNNCDYLQADYNWETAEHEEYDFDTDFEIEKA